MSFRCWDFVTFIKRYMHCVKGRTHDRTGFRRVPVLHFIYMTVFEDAHHDPVLVIEVNLDGAAGPFWAQLEVVIGPQLRDRIRCCKRPRDVSAAMFDRIAAKDARLHHCRRNKARHSYCRGHGRLCRFLVCHAGPTARARPEGFQPMPADPRDDAFRPWTP
jgi:hypothetical protein